MRYLNKHKKSLEELLEYFNNKEILRVEVEDLYDTESNVNNIEELYIDNKLVWIYKNDNFSFSNIKTGNSGPVFIFKETSQGYKLSYIKVDITRFISVKYSDEYLYLTSLKIQSPRKLGLWSVQRGVIKNDHNTKEILPPLYIKKSELINLDTNHYKNTFINLLKLFNKTCFKKSIELICGDRMFNYYKDMDIKAYVKDNTNICIISLYGNPIVSIIHNSMHHIVTYYNNDKVSIYYKYHRTNDVYHIDAEEDKGFAQWYINIDNPDIDKNNSISFISIIDNNKGVVAYIKKLYNDNIKLEIDDLKDEIKINNNVYKLSMDMRKDIDHYIEEIIHYNILQIIHRVSKHHNLPSENDNFGNIKIKF